MDRISQRQNYRVDDCFSEREYYVAPRRGRKHRGGLIPIAIFLLGVLLFGGGFLLGRAQAAQGPARQDTSAVPAASIPQASAAVQDGIAPQQPVAPVEHTDSGQASGGETADEADWNLLLVNSQHPLSEDFAVPELTRLKNGHAIDSRAYPALQEMMDAARAAGYQPLICSSFRTWDKQEELFSRKVRYYQNRGYSREEAEERAAVWVARPGTSEHQAGLAVDIVDVSYQLLDEDQENTPVQQWLMAHCAEYGFILRYPSEKSDITGVGYEPWHYRYVGEEAAKAIMEQGICLEEYLNT